MPTKSKKAKTMTLAQAVQLTKRKPHVPTAAGLKEGDVVVAINKNFSQNMQLYKAALQNTGDRVNIVVRRDGELLVFDFKVKSIL